MNAAYERRPNHARPFFIASRLARVLFLFAVLQQERLRPPGSLPGPDGLVPRR